jgi:hypothetical protein
MRMKRMRVPHFPRALCARSGAFLIFASQST